MGLRPKTARRLALIGALFLILVVGGIAALTIPGMQRTRKIESFRADGLAAHEAGDHQKAVVLLGRYNRAVGEQFADPDAMLAQAQSRAELEAPRRQQYAVAAKLYRAYLRRVPDDDKATRELISVLREAGLSAEVIEQANRRRDSRIAGFPKAELGTLTAAQRAQADQLRVAAIAQTTSDEFDVMRDEYFARASLDISDPFAIAIEKRLLAEEEPEFSDIWLAYRRGFETRAGLMSSERAAVSSDLVIDAVGRTPEGSLGGQLLRMQLLPNKKGGMPKIDKDFVNAYAAIFGLNPDNGETIDEVKIDDPEVAWRAIQFLDHNGRFLAAASLVGSAARDTGDSELIENHALRRFVLGQFDLLFEIDVPEERRVEFVDILGYQAMAAEIVGDEERSSELQRELESVDFQFQAKSWLDALIARRALKEGDLVTARASLTTAIERHTFEPTLPVLLGDVFAQMGFPADAMESWREASLLVKPMVWPDPYIRWIGALLESDRGLEAYELLDELLQSYGYQQNVGLLILRVQVSAALARNGQLQRERIENAVQLATRLKAYVQDDFLAEIDVSLATLLAAYGRPEQAREVLANVIALAGQSELALQAIEVDRRFGLGLSDEIGWVSLPDRIENPRVALRSAITYCASGGDPAGRIETALAMLQAGVENSSESDRAEWLLVTATFMGEYKIEGDREMWEAAIAADPKNTLTIVESIDSPTFQYDLEYIDSMIDRIRQLTASDGRTLSSRIRLARAKAVLGLTPNRDERNAALAIIRSVVASEQQNVLARRMLAQTLMKECDETILEDQRFEPDYPASIEQFRILVSQIDGVESVGYLLEIVRLSRFRDDTEGARDALDEVARRADDNDVVALRFVREVIKLGDPESIVDLLEDLFERTSGSGRTRTGLLLAQTYDSLGDNENSGRILSVLAETGDLGVDEINELAARMVLVGLLDQAQAFVADTAKFGLTDAEQATVQAQFAVRFGTPEESEAMLVELVELNPTNLDAIVMLAKLYGDQGRSEESLAVAKTGLERHPQNPDLLFYVTLAQDGPADAVRSLLGTLVDGSASGAASSGFSDAQREEVARLQKAFDQIEAFEQTRADVPPSMQIEQLAEIQQRYITLATVVRYTLAERESLGEATATLYRDASAAARRHTSDPGLLSIAARVGLAAGEFDEAEQFATAWRGIVTDSRLEPDLYLAEAAQRQENHARVLALLEPYLSSAFESPDEPFNRQVLLFFGRSEIFERGESAARARLEPLVGTSAGFRSTVWLDLAVTATSTPKQAETWLAIADQAGLDEYLVRLAGVWLRLADRFEDRQADFAQRSVQVAARAIERNPQDASAYATQAFALRELGEVEPDGDWLARAEAQYLKADELAPQDLNLLFGAAMAASRDDRPDDAERHYRELMTRDGVTGLFQAAIRNNLAAVLTWGDRSEVERTEALELANAAIEFRPVSAFIGTRGWLHYSSRRWENAIADFDRVTREDPGSFEGWAGLAASMKANGDSALDVQRAWRRALSVYSDDLASPKIMKVLSGAGFDTP